MVETLALERGHIILLSSKYHAECAGQGIEYDFGRVKWYFRKWNSHSTEGLKKGSARAFGADVVTLRHTRKFARRCRDYMRAYRAGAMGLEADSRVRLVKTHRCALDTDFTFVTED